MNVELNSSHEESKKAELQKIVDGIWDGRELYSIMHDCVRLGECSFWMLDNKNNLRTERCLPEDVEEWQCVTEELFSLIDKAEVDIREGQKVQFLQWNNREWMFAIRKSIFAGDSLGTFVFLDYVHEDVQKEELPFWKKTGVIAKVVTETISRQICQLQMTYEIERMKKNEVTADEERARLQHENDYDMLTQVHSRSYFFRATERFQNREDLLPISVIVGDVNSLKFTNDMYGHRHGDWLLQVVAKILQEEAEYVRKENNIEEEFVVARCGGDEFFVLLPKSKRAVTNYFCKRVVNRLSEVSTCCLPPTISLGSAKKSEMTQDLNRMLEIADAKMYAIKSESKQEYDFFEEMMKVLYMRKFLTPEIVEKRERLTKEFAEYLKWDTEQIALAVLLARYQDIGLTIVPERVYFKETYTEREWREIKKHPQIGSKVALSDSRLAPISECINQTHENWDGSGWTRGLKGFEINVLAQLVRVVTEYIDWLRDGEEEAKKKLEENKDHIFSADLAGDFLKFLEEEKNNI